MQADHGQADPYHDARDRHQDELAPDVPRDDAVRQAGGLERRGAHAGGQELEELLLEGRKVHQEVERQDRDQDDLDHVRQPPAGGLGHAAEGIHEEHAGPVDGVVQLLADGGRHVAVERRARVRHERAELHLVLPHVLHEPLELGGDRAGRDDEHPGDHRDHQEVGEGDRADTRRRAAGEPEPADPVDEREQGVRQHRRQRDRDQGEAEAVQEKHRRRRQDDPDCDPDPALDRHHGFFRFALEEDAPFSGRREPVGHAIR